MTPKTAREIACLQDLSVNQLVDRYERLVGEECRSRNKPKGQVRRGRSLIGCLGKLPWAAAVSQGRFQVTLMLRQTLTNWREPSRLASVSALLACLSVSLIGASTAADQFSPRDTPPGWQRVEALQRTPVFSSLDLDQASDAFDSEHAMVRIAALSAITRSNDPVFLDLVIDRLQDPDQLTRRLALAVLTRFRGEAVDAAFLIRVEATEPPPVAGACYDIEWKPDTCSS